MPYGSSSEQYIMKEDRWERTVENPSERETTKINRRCTLWLSSAWKRNRVSLTWIIIINFVMLCTWDEMRVNAIFIHTWSPSRLSQLEGWISSSVIVTLNKLAYAAFSTARLCWIPSRNDKLQNNCLTFPTDDSTAVFRHERVSRSWGRMKMTFHWFIRCCRMHVHLDWDCSVHLHLVFIMQVPPKPPKIFAWILSNPSTPEQLQIEFQNATLFTFK